MRWHPTLPPPPSSPDDGKASGGDRSADGRFIPLAWCHHCQLLVGKRAATEVAMRRNAGFRTMHLPPPPTNRNPLVRPAGYDWKGGSDNAEFRNHHFSLLPPLPLAHPYARHWRWGQQLGSGAWWPFPRCLLMPLPPHQISGPAGGGSNERHKHAHFFPRHLKNLAPSFNSVP